MKKQVDAIQAQETANKNMNAGDQFSENQEPYLSQNNLNQSDKLQSDIQLNLN
tara:strand:- start:248 stop:406 length:159 start_codon:yes stop_codon:yes gene_type:complete